jgi:hypothetical protein
MTEPAATQLREDFTLLLHPQPPPVVASAPGIRDEYYVPAAAVLALLVAWLLWRWLKGVARRVAVERADIAALRDLSMWQQVTDVARYREVVAGVSATVRRYVEARFGLRAPTLTTEEFWAEQCRNRRIPADHDPFWSEFLSACDPVKYAGMTPGAEQLRLMVDSAIAFVEASSARRLRARRTVDAP